MGRGFTKRPRAGSTGDENFITSTPWPPGSLVAVMVCEEMICSGVWLAFAASSISLPLWVMTCPRRTGVAL
jgi:hypothetical protein